MIPLSRPWLDDGEKEAVLRVVNSGWLVQGAEVERLEDIMSERLEAHAVAVSSGSMALILSLQALENQRRYVSHIIAPSYTFIATVSAILHVSAHPVLADIDKRTYNLDANVLPVRDNGGASIDGIIAVHQVGLPCDVPAVARRVPNAFIIEDAACAFGARVNGKEIGFGGGLVPATVAVCFSFHASKSIVAGEGGLVVMRDNAMAKEIRMLRDHGATVSADKRVGADGSYLEEVYARVGWNARMTDLCAAVAIEQIRKSSDILTHRRELAERYAHHPSLAGLSVRLSADGYAQLPGPDWGLDDATIAQLSPAEIQERYPKAWARLMAGARSKPGRMLQYFRPAKA